MKSIDDHTEMVTHMVCRYLWCYMTENPDCSYTDAIQGLTNTIFALSSGQDQIIEDLCELCGPKSGKIMVPEFVDFLEFDPEEYPDAPWSEDDEDDDED